MKKLKSILIVLLFVASAIASSFCNGYKAGYKAGYCYQQYGCIKPIPPICPIPNIGERDYIDGYNRGFIDGLNAR